MQKRNYDFPEKLQFLFDPMRYKVARGGRGSAKSWSFARALLILGLRKRLRVLCTREVQKSIKDSVLRLLADQIKLLRLEKYYRVMDNEIRGVNGTLFIFCGLSSQTTDQLKSYEGIDIVWCEEAQSISKRSWDVLLPTIRKPGSEIWISYNPELETDETHKRFSVNVPDNCQSVVVNYSDNPWFSDVLEKERLRCKEIDPDNYDNIWEGKCKPAVSGAIYYHEIEKAQTGKQICNLPYDPMLKVHVVFDMGWNDAMTISLVQKLRSEVRIIEYIEDSHKTLDHYSAELKKKNLNWGKVFLPHDGNHKDYKSGKSAVDIMQKLGWEVELVTNMSIEAGIKLVRMAFSQIFFDKDKTGRLIECIKRYRRVQSQSTGEFGQPLHDEYSHGVDNLRYIAIAADRMTNGVQRWQEKSAGDSMAAFV